MFTSQVIKQTNEEIKKEELIQALANIISAYAKRKTK